MVNFKEDDPFDPKAVWLNAEHIRTLPVDELSRACCRCSSTPASMQRPEKMAAITPLIRERIKLLSDVVAVADFFFVDAAGALRSRPS